MLKVECGGIGDCPDREAATYLSYPRQHGNVLAVDCFVVGHIGTRDVHQVVGVASHEVTTLYVRDIVDLGFELIEEFFTLRLE